MVLEKISLINFKFHHNLSFEIKNKNCLVYGENGSGKSSIYEALYANMYEHKTKGEKRDVQEKYRHRDYPNEAMEVSIIFDNKKELKRKNNVLENSDWLQEQTLYCANERLLRKLTEHDFYDVINNILLEHFSELENISVVYNPLSRNIKKYKYSTQKIADKVSIVEERIAYDEKFKAIFNKTIPIDKINRILMDSFDEDFQIEFKVSDSSIDFSTADSHFSPPKINVKVKDIDDRGDFQSHFNEAKLKLISIAIYFALAKKNEGDSELKILVLDDFLTSLDMANRKLIIQYILEEFSDYQKIIFTHNIQFYNLIIKLLNMRGENNDWDVKNIFLSNENNKEVATIYSLHPSYLTRAEKKLKEGELESTGNFLRKEFERIMAEFEQILAIGKKESLQGMINSLKTGDCFYEDPQKILRGLIADINEILADNKDNIKISKIKTKIRKLEKSKSKFTSSNATLIRKTELYKNILMNKTSHYNPEVEFYKKEFKTTIKLLKELNKVLDHLKPPELKKKK